jgi:hypothetical protein
MKVRFEPRLNPTRRSVTRRCREILCEISFDIFYESNYERTLFLAVTEEDRGRVRVIMSHVTVVAPGTFEYISHLLPSTLVTALHFRLCPRPKLPLFPSQELHDQSSFST